MAILTKIIAGQEVKYDRHANAWVDAVGDNVVKYVDDFEHMAVDDTTGFPVAWYTNVVDVGASASTITFPDAQNGIVKFEAADNDNDGIQCQHTGYAFQLTAGDPCVFSIRWKVDEATQSDLAFGLIVKDTDILGGVAEGVYFRKNDGGVALEGVTETGSVETSTPIANIADNTWYIDEFYWNGTSRIFWYHNSTIIGNVSTNIPTGTRLLVSVSYFNGAAQADKGMHVDWIRAIQLLAAR